MVKKILSSIVFVLLAISCRGESLSLQLRDGDIIFQTSQSAQSIAIQKATHSKYSHNPNPPVSLEMAGRFCYI
jgi:hypothetical protein